MSSLALRKDRAISLPQYERHKPEQTLLYQIIEQYYPAFSRLMEQQGRPLPFSEMRPSGTRVHQGPMYLVPQGWSGRL
jgi:hypothetical protein